MSNATLLSSTLTDQPDARQYVLQAGAHRLRVEYDRQGDRMFLTSVDVPKALQDGDASDVLLHKVLTHLEEKRLKLVPVAPAVKAYLRNHPDWKRVLVKGIHI